MTSAAPWSHNNLHSAAHICWCTFHTTAITAAQTPSPGIGSVHHCTVISTVCTATGIEWISWVHSMLKETIEIHKKEKDQMEPPANPVRDNPHISHLEHVNFDLVYNKV